ncbi:MAG: 8-amino-7-oxononanoate synthase [Candidatus Scalindua rubra]|uniref:8-amino-7-ketopelargonate synthase n=1 Tax=Candidatus Scalindua brodae TaxID=237368 RepID=A0A0B0EG49_9BACT|nr:MAG: 8-amino-7-oxononanoate synthase [Candidatus Scalindua brodae]MBZ0108340.1 8-amino-7-oxononanoate synthase [Candidatus Scalindua rubra]TWU34036.1 8-amino-7-oxononanoate synthase [Candidatus Brocadiaceae bacterium S225]
MKYISDELIKIRESGLYRDLTVVGNAQDSHIEIEGKPFLSFCSNNYLGLANHPSVVKAVKDAVGKYGWGAGASRLVSGNMTLHEVLEGAISRFKGKEAAIVFPTGYMANLGAITSLVSNGDLVICDKLNHASIIDGCRLSGADFRVYAHCNMEKLENILKKASKYNRKLIVTDSVFSMDGDLAPLPDIVRVATEYNALIMVDEAHGTGVFGKNGRGVVEHFNLNKEIDVIMGTLSKAIGSLGGYVSGDIDLISYLRNKARSFMYTTALPPAVCAASIAGINLIQGDHSMRESLWYNVRFIKDKLRSLNINMISSESQIIPILIGDAQKAVEISKLLYERGVLIPAIRPPTVPANSSRLRMTVMSSHTQGDLECLIEALSESLVSR